MKPSIKIYKIDQYLEIQTLGFIPDFKQKLQEITLPDWNQSLKRWIIEFRPEYIEQLKNTFTVFEKHERDIKKIDHPLKRKPPIIHQLNAEGILHVRNLLHGFNVSDIVLIL